MRPQYNYKGESVVGVKRKLLKPEYGTGKEDEYGIPLVKWGYFLTAEADNEGFDTEHEESNKKHTIEITLPKGTVILRYGDENGRYTAPKGTAYEELALPYVPETMEYNEYEVIADGLTVQCIVTKGKVAMSIEGTGGGVQYKHNEPITRLIRKGALERLKLWA